MTHLMCAGGRVKRAATSPSATISQAALAERMGVDRAYVNGLEQGQRNPTVITLWRVAKPLGVPIASLFVIRETG
jgi:transcriptional regulator with XRE-family HTH domain